MSIAKVSSYNHEEIYKEENFVRETLADILKFPMPSQAFFFQCIHIILHTLYLAHLYKYLYICSHFTELHKAAHVKCG